MNRKQSYLYSSVGQVVNGNNDDRSIPFVDSDQINLPLSGGDKQLINNEFNKNLYDYKSISSDDTLISEGGSSPTELIPSSSVIKNVSGGHKLRRNSISMPCGLNALDLEKLQNEAAKNNINHQINTSSHNSISSSISSNKFNENDIAANDTEPPVNKKCNEIKIQLPPFQDSDDDDDENEKAPMVLLYEKFLKSKSNTCPW